MGEVRYPKVVLGDAYVPLSSRIAIARKNGVMAREVLTDRGKTAVEISTKLTGGAPYIVGSFVFSDAEEKVREIMGLGRPVVKVTVEEDDEGRLTVGIVGDKSRFPILAGVDPVERMRELLGAKGIDADIELVP